MQSILHINPRVSTGRFGPGMMNPPKVLRRMCTAIRSIRPPTPSRTSSPDCRVQKKAPLWMEVRKIKKYLLQRPESYNIGENGISTLHSSQHVSVFIFYSSPWLLSLPSPSWLPSISQKHPMTPGHTVRPFYHPKGHPFKQGLVVMLPYLRMDNPWHLQQSTPLAKRSFG